MFLIFILAAGSSGIAQMSAVGFNAFRGNTNFFA